MLNLKTSKKEIIMIIILINLIILLLNSAYSIPSVLNPEQQMGDAELLKEYFGVSISGNNLIYINPLNLANNVDFENKIQKELSTYVILKNGIFNITDNKNKEIRINSNQFKKIYVSDKYSGKIKFEKFSGSIHSKNIDIQFKKLTKEIEFHSGIIKELKNIKTENTCIFSQDKHNGIKCQDNQIYSISSNYSIKYNDKNDYIIETNVSKSNNFIEYSNNPKNNIKISPIKYSKISINQNGIIESSNNFSKIQSINTYSSIFLNNFIGKIANFSSIKNNNLNIQFIDSLKLSSENRELNIINLNKLTIKENKFSSIKNYLDYYGIKYNPEKEKCTNNCLYYDVGCKDFNENEKSNSTIIEISKINYKKFMNIRKAIGTTKIEIKDKTFDKIILGPFNDNTANIDMLISGYSSKVLAKISVTKDKPDLEKNFDPKLIKTEIIIFYVKENKLHVMEIAKGKVNDFIVESGEDEKKMLNLPYGDPKCKLTDTQPTSKDEFIFACEKIMSKRSDCKTGKSIFNGECESFWTGANNGNVNPYFILSLAIHEGACGTSNIALSKKNTYGWGAIDSNPYGGAKTFKEMNWEQINSYISSEIYRRWLSPNPKWSPQRKSLSEMSGNTATGPVYATHNGWAPGIANLMSKLLDTKCLDGKGFIYNKNEDFSKNVCNGKVPSEYHNQGTIETLKNYPGINDGTEILEEPQTIDPNIIANLQNEWSEFLKITLDPKAIIEKLITYDEKTQEQIRTEILEPKYGIQSDTFNLNSIIS